MLPRAPRPLQFPLLAHGGEQRLRQFERRFRPAGHDRQLGVARAHVAAGNGRIESLAAEFPRSGADFRGQQRRRGGHIDEQLARRKAREQASFAEVDLLHVARIADDRDHRVGRAHHIRGTLRPRRAGCQQRFGGSLAAVGDRQIEAGLHQVRRHRSPHHAQSDKTDFSQSHQNLSFLLNPARRKPRSSPFLFHSSTDRSHEAT